MESAPASRTDILEECRFRIAVLSEFAPEEMSEEQIRLVIADVLAELELTSPTSKDKGIITVSYTHLDVYKRQIQNLGIGGAIQTGYLYARREGYDIAVQFDGDGQHDLECLPQLIEPIIQNRCV